MKGWLLGLGFIALTSGNGFLRHHVVGSHATDRCMFTLVKFTYVAGAWAIYFLAKLCKMCQCFG